MEVRLQIQIDDEKMKGLQYCQKVIDTMKQLRMEMDPSLKKHCENTINRMCELAESLEIGWRAWVTSDFNQELQKHPLLQKMVCCEQADIGYRFSHDD